MKIPKRINLAHLPTPVETLKFNGKQFLIKRDDFTGSDLAGNKVRKLEYLLFEAKQHRADIIFTCGGEQSNHARATASAAAKLGIKTKLFLWGDKRRIAEGNLFLNKIYGAEIEFLTKNDFSNVDAIMTEERKKLIRKGKKVYVIPAGGSSTLGIWGYIEFINELKKQIDLKKIDGILTACGSGGTSAGLMVGCALNKLSLKIYAVNVLLPEKEIKKKILQLAEGSILDYNLSCSLDADKLAVVDGYSKEGYKNITDNKLKLISKFACENGILLDPAYTGKAFAAYNNLILNKRKGKRNIFLHTGGIYGAFSKKESYLKFA